MASPIGTPSLVKEYQIKTYDWSNESGQKITAKQIYKDHVSKSIPCVFKNSIADLKIVQELKTIDNK